MPVPFDDVTVIVGSASYPSPLFVKNTSLIDDASASVAKVSCSNIIKSSSDWNASKDTWVSSVNKLSPASDPPTSVLSSINKSFSFGGYST